MHVVFANNLFCLFRPCKHFFFHFFLSLLPRKIMVRLQRGRLFQGCISLRPAWGVVKIVIFLRKSGRRLSKRVYNKGRKKYKKEGERKQEGKRARLKRKKNQPNKKAGKLAGKQERKLERKKGRKERMKE